MTFTIFFHFLFPTVKWEIGIKSEKIKFDIILSTSGNFLFMHLLDILDLPSTLCSKIEIAVPFNYLLW